MLTQILDALVPVFFGMGLGYLGGKTRDLDNKNVGELNALVMDFAVPTSMFAAIASTSRALLLRQLPFAAVITLSMLVLFATTFVIARYVHRIEASEASVQALTTSFPNFAAAGLPLIAALLGSKALISVAVAIACGSIVVSPICLVILESNASGARRSIGQSVASAFLKPIVLAPVAAIAIVLAGVPIPAFIQDSLTLVGQVSGGAGLFLTGLILSAQSLKISTNVSVQVGLANVVHPALTAGLAKVFALAPLAAHEAIVLSALPSGFFGILFALRFKVPSAAVGTTLIVSTVLSIATLSATIYLTAGMGRT